MSQRKLLSAQKQPTMTGGRTVLSSPADFAEEWFWEARKRLAAASLVMAIIWTIALLLNNYLLRPEGEAAVGMFEMTNIIGTFIVAVSLFMILLTRIRRLKSNRVMGVGLLYFVFVSFTIAAVEISKPLSDYTMIWGVSWLCVWIVAFPLVVPIGPIRMFFTTFVGASMGPLAFALLFMAGSPIDISLDRVILMYLPNYIAVAAAVYFSRVVYQLGKDVSAAKEMGSYKLIKLLGRGGMGEVWLARHQMLARPAAIKVVSKESLGTMKAETRELTFKRFIREAKSTAALKCPNTIQVYDFGITDSGEFFYVMEFLDGMDLSTFMDNFGTPSPARLAHLLRQACHSLREAHDNGMIHRDIKPANIFLCRLGPLTDFIKVLDFGLVKTTDDFGGELETELTTKGQIFGTPAYMAPEMAAGESRMVDARSDIYALGCVAYRLLTGRNVFEGSTPMQVILAHASQPPVPPSQITKTTIPPELERLVLDCLEKNPARRPQTVGEIIRRLDAIPLTDSWTPQDADAWWEANYRPRNMPDDEPTASQAVKPAAPPTPVAPADQVETPTIPI